LKSGFGCGNLLSLMSLADLKDNVMALPESERHDFVVWLNRLEQNYGDIPGEALAEMAAEVWEQDDRRLRP
jgi:phage-related protein